MSRVKYLIYDIDNNILGGGQCNSDHLHLKAGDNFLAVIDNDVVLQGKQKYIDGEIVDVPPTNTDLLKILRRHRAELLAYSDWTQIPDAPLSEEQVSAWKLYRQALRDLPDTHSEACLEEDIEWPLPPA